MLSLVKVIEAIFREDVFYMNPEGLIDEMGALSDDTKYYFGHLNPDYEIDIYFFSQSLNGIIPVDANIIQGLEGKVTLH